MSITSGVKAKCKGVYELRPQRAPVASLGRYLSCASASAVCPGLRLSGVQADTGTDTMITDVLIQCNNVQSYL